MKVKSRPENFMNQPGQKTLYDFKATTLDGVEIDFSSYKGKKVLIVNVASECGYTPQYTDLQKLSEDYMDKLVVLGFPSNEFGGQESGTNEDIKSFCRDNYGVTFPVFQKTIVKGDGKHPVYEWLTNKEQNGWNEQKPNWNFCKYLVDENGNLVKFFSFRVKPLSDEIISELK